MHQRRLLLVAAAAVLAALVASTASAQLVGATVTVKEASLKIIVYPDGSLQPVYKLYAVITPPNATSTKFNIVVKDYVKAAANSTQGSASITGYLYMEDLGEKVTLRHAYIAISRVSTAVGTESRSTITGTIEVVTKNRNVYVKIDKLLLERRGTTATIYLSALIKGVNSSRITSLVTGKTGAAGVLSSFIHVTKLSYTQVGPKETHVEIEVTLDIAKMVSKAESEGMPPAEAQKLLKLLQTPVNMNSTSKLKLEASMSGDNLTFTLTSISSSRGEVRKYSRLLSQEKGLITKLYAYLLRAYAAATGNMKLEQLSLALTSAKAATLPVEQVPPYQSTLDAVLKTLPDGKVLVKIYYKEPRIALVAPGKTPSEKAETLLTILSLQLGQLRSELLRLGLVMPGIARVLPQTVELVPASPTVKISQARVPLAELSAVKVAIAAHTATATAPATTTTHTASTTTTTTTTTSPAAAQTTTTATKTTTTTTTTTSTTHSYTHTTTTTETEEHTETEHTSPTTTSASTTTASPTTTPAATKGTGISGADILAAAVIIGAAIVVASAMRRR